MELCWFIYVKYKVFHMSSFYCFMASFYFIADQQPKWFPFIFFWPKSASSVMCGGTGTGTSLMDRALRLSPMWCAQEQRALRGCPQPLSRAGGAAVWHWCCGSGDRLQLSPQTRFSLDAVGGFPVWWSSSLSPWFKPALTPWVLTEPAPARREVAKGLTIFRPIFSCYFSSLLFNPPCQKHSLETGKAIGRRRCHQKFISDN